MVLSHLTGVVAGAYNIGDDALSGVIVFVTSIMSGVIAVVAAVAVVAVVAAVAVVAVVVVVVVIRFLLVIVPP
jgi:hypothetical protein